jgi:hypothetical protein
MRAFQTSGTFPPAYDGANGPKKGPKNTPRPGKKGK